LTNIEEVMRRLMARITAKIFMGDTASRDPSWINISVGFSVDLFESSFGIKMFPPWTYPFIVWLIPARYRVRRQLAATRQMVDKLLQRLNDAQARRRQGETVDEEDTLLNWMVENGKPWENTVPQMAARLCVLAMASIHTTAATLANVVYELCAHPEWIPVLQEEIDTIAQDLGKPDDNLASEGSTSKQWCERLEKLDSFIMESQRHNPVMILNPQRLATEPIMLSGGVYIPAGTRLAFANHEHHMDPRTHPDPAVFDPLRSYRKRHAAANQRHLHLADQTHPSALSFGYGNQACAGRHFAVAVMKLIMARMLYEFDFRFPEGQGMPENRYVDENVYKDLGARVEMRRRARG
jgi:cytochrome P450